MERFLVPLNMTAGTLFLVIALAYPVLDDKIFTGGKKSVVQQLVARLAQLETSYYQTHELYRTFSPENMPDDIKKELGLVGVSNAEFIYDAFLVERGQLVLRAQASPGSIRSGSLPPLIYTLRLSAGAQLGEGTWELLSGKKPGFF
ncbi:MAG: hypothetical protein HQL84_08525 [Magnetococcales bacterium]|nr:hypothetical protein [Magnetococcales bacterium]MBF0150075.1 hypothetical protein [Magnetococcales bacterium]